LCEVEADAGRPIINDSESKDELIQLIRHRYHIDFPYESMYGCQLEEAQDLINRDKYNELLTRILIKFRTLSAPGAPSYLMKYLGLLSPNI
jgi:phosphate acetyltransferase